MTGFVEPFIVAAIVAVIAAPHLRAGIGALRALVPAMKGDEGRRSV
jgi:hypothetical protein